MHLNYKIFLNVSNDFNVRKSVYRGSGYNLKNKITDL